MLLILLSRLAGLALTFVIQSLKVPPIVSFFGWVVCVAANETVVWQARYDTYGRAHITTKSVCSYLHFQRHTMVNWKQLFSATSKVLSVLMIALLSLLSGCNFEGKDMKADLFFDAKMVSLLHAIQRKDSAAATAMLAQRGWAERAWWRGHYTITVADYAKRPQCRWIGIATGGGS